MSANTGAMIAYFLPESLSTRLAAMANDALLENPVPTDVMHLTVVYFGEAADITTEQCEAIKTELTRISACVSPLPASVNGIGRFTENDPNPVIANFDAPGLAELRATLIAALRAAGVEPNLDHGYTPHITLAYVPAERLPIALTFDPIPCNLDAITLTLGDERIVYPLSGSTQLSEVNHTMTDQLNVLDTGVKPDEKTELVAEISISTPSFAFRGSFPEVPFAPGVDVDQLTAGDEGKPLFVVRPLAVLNEVSDAGLEYDKELVEEIRQQVLLKKPPARQGHIPKENVDWEFPNDVGLWVGAEMFGNTLYGKAYIYPRTLFHQMTLKRKAAGSTLSNSIWGKGNWIVKPNGNKGLRGLDLESIDFAPAERASLGALGGEFGTTSEMKTNDTEDTMAEENKPDPVAQMRTQLAEMEPKAVHEMLNPAQRRHCAEMHFAEMEPSGIYEMLPAGHRTAIHECYVKEFGPATTVVNNAGEGVAEMKPSAELLARVSEMETANKSMLKQIAEFKQEKFDNTLESAAFSNFSAWNVKSDDHKKAVASAKDNFKMYIVAEMATMDGGQKIENIDAATKAAWPKYEPQAALLRTALSGGNVIVGAQGVSEVSQSKYGYDPKTGRYEDAQAAQARAQVMGG